MALLNPTFDDAGALPGEAAHWTLTAVTSLEVLAGFGTAPEDAWEDFERWIAFLAALADVTVVRAFFGNEPRASRRSTAAGPTRSTSSSCRRRGSSRAPSVAAPSRTARRAGATCRTCATGRW